MSWCGHGKSAHQLRHVFQAFCPGSSSVVVVIIEEVHVGNAIADVLRGTDECFEECLDCFCKGRQRMSRLSIVKHVTLFLIIIHLAGEIDDWQRHGSRG